jgi:hypothetical protein
MKGQGNLPFLPCAAQPTKNGQNGSLKTKQPMTGGHHHRRASLGIERPEYTN